MQDPLTRSSGLRVLNALLDPGRDHTLGAHSSHNRKPIPPAGWQRKYQL